MVLCPFSSLIWLCQGNGYWATAGTNADPEQLITISEWIDRLAPKALAVVAAGTCAMASNSTSASGRHYSYFATV
ncbi:MAG TPA: hypothetical protein VJO32_00355 [Ktedonobacteraceae bacterium]|nr:hypothetical protein [Ktedonobacteraceae bacterium]